MHAVNDPKPLDLQAIEPVLGDACPQLPLAQGHSVAIEKFRLLAHRLHRARAKKPLRTVLVTSAVPSEGKSTVALSLAATLAAKGAPTVLVDADLRGPDLEKMLGFRSLPGLGRVLRGEFELDRALRRIDPLGIFFLAAGDRTHNPLPLLESPAFAGVLNRVREAFDWVIIDSAPLNPVADTLGVASLVDAILLVVRWSFTPKEELEHAVTSLDGLPLAGIVVNRFDEPQDSYYHSYYTRPETPPALPPPD